MSVDAISSASGSGPKHAAAAFDPNQPREREVLRETLQRSFPTMETEQLDESIKLALKFAGSHPERTEVIGLARIYLARRLETQGVGVDNTGQA